jgi:outer membrane protein assembly factor BamB
MPELTYPPPTFTPLSRSQDSASLNLFLPETDFWVLKNSKASRANLSALSRFAPSGTKKWEFVTGAHVYSSPAIGSDGTIYVDSNDNKLYALRSTSAGLASSAWPKFHHDNQNTGRK